jgi:hypothetical protein
MVWYLTPDQVFISHRNSKLNKKDDNDKSRETSSYDLSVNNLQSIENKWYSSKKPRFYAIHAREVTR